MIIMEKSIRKYWALRHPKSSGAHLCVAHGGIIWRHHEDLRQSPGHPLPQLVRPLAAAGLLFAANIMGKS